MKKYWKSILLSAMIVFGIGAFYFQGAFASTGSDFKLATISGDAKESKNVQLEVDYEINGLYDYSLISSDGTKRREDYSYFEQLDGKAGNPQYARLLMEYRSFMRGKDVWSDLLYEDDDHLAYANVDYDFRSFHTDNYSLDMAVLNKASHKSTEFTYHLEDQGPINHMQVVGVNKTEDQLFVFTSVFTPENDEIRVYTFDLHSQELVAEERIGENDKLGEDEDVMYWLLQPSGSLMSGDYMVAQKEIYSPAKTGPIENELITYELATGKTESLELPKRLKDKTHVNMFDGQSLYFIETEDDGVTIVMYDIMEQSISNEIFVEIDIQEGAFEEDLMDYDEIVPPESYSVMTMKNDRLYIGISQAGTYELLQLLIVDMDTGDIVYEGEVAPEVPEDLPEEVHMELYDIFVE